MSELIENTKLRKEMLKHLMLQVQQGEAPEAVRGQLTRMMGEVPYDTVVEVEQELMSEGLSSQEILKFCDIHTDVLKGKIAPAKPASLPGGHPARTFREENRALRFELDMLGHLFDEISALPAEEPAGELMDQVRIRFYALGDVEKHYDRKENLLFPYLEKHGITGPSRVMWAKDDEVRELVRNGIESLRASADLSASAAGALIELVLSPARDSLADMIYREEQILIPMALDVLTESEWHAIYQQSPKIGFCLYDPPEDWKPETMDVEGESVSPERVQFPSGSLTPLEIDAIFSNIPFDLTFVDKDDRVRYFTRGRERIFARSRAILGRKVQLCHPPSSVHIVQQILEDFRSGRESRAPFWIDFKGKFIHIEYFALRNAGGEYLGTLEVSQDLTGKRSLAGEQRLLAYANESSHDE